MGLLGDIVGGLAEAALEGIGNKIQENVISSNLDDCSEFGILFDHDEYEPFHEPEIRNDMVQTILIQIGNTIGVEVNNNNVNKTWMAFIDDSYADGEMWDAFVLKNNSLTVRYGLYGDAECALFIRGENCGQYAYQIKHVLENMNLDNVRFYFGDIPFNEVDWIESAESKLESIQDTKKKPPKMNGDKTKAAILFKKFNEIFLRDVDEIYDISNLDYKIEQTYFLLSDDIVSIEFSSDTKINDFFYISYEKNKKTLHFSFQVSNPYGATIKISLEDSINNSKTEFSTTFFGPDYTLIDALDFIVKKNVEVPENFYDNMQDFILNNLNTIKELSQNSSAQDYSDDGDDSDILEEIQDALEILELSEEDITTEEIRTAYRRLAKEFHPDKMQGLTPKMQKIAESEMQKLRDAYELLIEYFGEE